MAVLGPWLAPATVLAQGTQTIVVVGSGAEQRAFDTPYAVSVVDADDLRAAGPMVNLSEALVRVPGLTVNLRNNYAQDLQVSSRGFGSRATFGVRGLRLYADGIPASGPDGQGQVSSFDLAGAARVEVLRGPFSALYGNSSGGVISIISRAPTERAVSLDLDAGSDGLRQARVGLDLPLPGGFSLAASGSAFEIDGFRPQSSAKRRLGNLRLGYDGEADRVVVSVNAIDQPALDPLGLTRAQFEAGPDQTAPQATQYDTRKELRQTQAGVQWQHRFTAAGPLQRSAVVLYSGRRSVTQWLAIPPGAQTPPSSGGGVVDFDRAYSGIDARLFWSVGPARLVTGVSQDEQRDDRRGYENFIGSGPAQQLGVTGTLRRDEVDRARTRDVYVQAEVDLSTTLAATAGVRHGRLRITEDDRFLSNGDESGQQAYGYTTPVVGLRWQPSTDWSVYASAGRGHEAPTLGELAYRADGGSGFNTGLQAQRSRQVEAGVKWRGPTTPSGGTAASGAWFDAALFRADTDDEIGIQTNSGGRSTYGNVGSTRRQGLELAAGSRIGRDWRVSLAATVLDATYRDTFLTCASSPCRAPTLAVPAGNRIAGTLPRSGFAEVVWAPGWLPSAVGGSGAAAVNPLELALEATGRGRQPVDDSNSDFAAGHGLLALRLLWRLPLPAELSFDGSGRSRVELLARVDNLIDRRVAGSVVVGDGNGRFFEPAAGRTWLLGLRLRAGF